MRYGSSSYFSSQHQSKANISQQKLLNPNIPKFPNGMKVMF
jgi:hypothetical protein